MEPDEHLDPADAATVGSHDLVVIVQKGADFEPSKRLNAALNELSEALAEQEVGEVAGFSFDSKMSFGALEGPEAQGIKIGCIRVDCLKGLGCQGRKGCTKTVNKVMEQSFSF